ncbi:hypothetical protein FRC01_007415 [Tulasnella sp. 417]|nr:hypothetical protein FRC01_007415 [Tulasnella sp. 417]
MAEDLRTCREVGGITASTNGSDHNFTFVSSLSIQPNNPAHGISAALRPPGRPQDRQKNRGSWQEQIMDYQGFGLGLGTASTFRPFGTQDEDEFGDSEPQVTWQSSQVANIRALLGDKKPAGSKGKDRGSSSRRVSASSSSSKLKSKASRRTSLPAPAAPGASPDDPIIVETQELTSHPGTTNQKPSDEASSAYASASSTPTLSTPGSGPSTSANSFASSEWEFFPPCFAGSSSSSGSSSRISSREGMSPNPGPIRRTKDPKRLRSKMAPMHRPSLASSVAGEGMDVVDHEGEEEKGGEARSTSVDSLQAMLRQFGTVVKERAAREVEVPSKAKDSMSKAKVAGPSSRKRDEGWDTKRPKDRTNGSASRVGEIRSAGRAQLSDDLGSMEPPSRRSRTRSYSPHDPLLDVEGATGQTSPVTEVQRPTTFKEPLPPTKREDKSTTFIRKDMPPPPVPRRPSPLREEQPTPPAMQEQRQLPPPKAASPAPQPSSSQTGYPSSSQGRRLGMTTYAATSSQGKANEPPRTVANDTYKGTTQFKPKSLGMRSAITTSSTTAPNSHSEGFKRSNSNRLPAFQPPMKKSMSPVPPPTPPPPAPQFAPATKSTTSYMDEDGDVSMTSSAGDISFGNSFEIDPGELDAIMSPYEQR